MSLPAYSERLCMQVKGSESMLPLQALSMSVLVD